MVEIPGPGTAVALVAAVATWASVQPTNLPIWFRSTLIVFGVFCIFMTILIEWLHRPRGNISQGENVAKTKVEGNGQTGNSAILAEYKALNQAWTSRGHETATYMSILITSSVLVAIAGLANLQELKDTFLFPVRTGGFVPLLAVVPLVFALVIRQTAYKLDELTFKRIHEIEKELGMKGHRAIWEEIQKTAWYKLRRIALPILIVVLATFYVSVALWIWFIWVP